MPAFGAMGFFFGRRRLMYHKDVQPTTFSIPAAFEWTGSTIDRLCARAGIRASGAFETDDFFRLWQTAEEEFGDAKAGLRLGRAGVLGGYGVASVVALHAPNFAAALSALARFKRLTCPELIEVESQGGEVHVRYRWLMATQVVPCLLADMVLASLAELARQGTDGRIAPIRVELSRRTQNAELLRRHFGCPIVFSATHDMMVFERAALDVPFVTADGGAFARVLDGLEQRLRRGEGLSALTADVRVAIARQLSAGVTPNVAAVAKCLSLTGRTLQRRLDESCTTFGQQLAEVRRLTARRLLAATDLDPIAVAMLLGFVEPNSFARAFRRWEHTTPARWRARQARPSAQSGIE